jgi:cytochrome c553
MRVFTGFAGLMALVYASVASAVAPAALPRPDLERGKQIATSVCAACHGPTGISTAPSNPNLAGQIGDYIASQLAAFKAGTRPSPIMQGMAAGLSPDDMRNLGAYFEIQKPAESVARDKALVARGQEIWRGGIKSLSVPACAGCHGAAGRGIPARFPRLAGQYADRNLEWLKAFATGSRPHEVMGPIASRLSENDMKAVVEYMAGLR